MENNHKMIGYLEERVTGLQAEINRLNKLIKSYTVVLNDYKKQARVDLPVNEFNEPFRKEEPIHVP